MDYWFMKRSWDFHQQWTGGEWGPCHEIVEGELIKTEGATLRCLSTPGHAEDHCSFFVEEDGTLFSGDQVLGFGTTFQQDLYVVLPTPPNISLACHRPIRRLIWRSRYDYMRTLHRMLSLRPTRLFPGHGPTIDDSVGFLERYIAHRQVREDQVYETTLALKQSTTMRIVRTIYTSTSEEKLWMARENVEKVLRKLEKENRVWAWLEDPLGYQMYRFPEGFVRRYPERLIWSPSAEPPAVGSDVGSPA